MQGLSPHMESRVPHHIPGVSSSLISQPLLDSQVPYGRLQHPLTIYPIDQMRSSHVENDYIDSPAVVSQQPPGGGQKSGGGGGGGSTRRAITWLGQSQQQQQQQDSSSGAFLGANHNHHHNHQQHGGRCEPAAAPHHPGGRQDATTHPWISFSGRPSSISSSSSTSSDQRLLDHAAPTPTLDPHLAPHPHHHHPHHHHPHQGSLGGSGAPARTLGCFAAAPPPSSSADPKVLTTASSSSSICSSSSKSLDLKASNATAGGGVGGGVGVGGVCGGQPQVSALIPSSPAEKKHLVLCERCGKCRCTECTLPRALPSCWVCNQECLCSAQSLVDSATCMCLVRGVFYHCAEDEDDEGSCADRPCSCSQANNCCARWSFMAALSVVLPCLLCYLPATGLAKLGQRCYDNASRPGCRCKQGTVGGAAQGTVGAGCKSGGGGGGVEGKAQGTTEKQQQQGS